MIETILILMLLAFIIGLIVGVVSTVAQICRHTWTSVVRAALIQSSVPGVPATF